jgi:GTP pyrophosphokinase
MPNGNSGLQGLPMPDGEWAYSQRFLLALDAAATMHAAQLRKGSSVPYISHLLGTCAIAMEYGANEDEAIAALLHDAIEDVRPTAQARNAVAGFGERVLAIVEGCTDSDTHPKKPWRVRKERYLAHLAEADASVLLVAGADKLHNARSLLIDLRRIGEEVWTRFNAGPDESLWFYRSVVAAMRANPAHHLDLVDELERTVEEIQRFNRG